MSHMGAGSYIVPAGSFVEALAWASIGGINPGGEVCGHRIVDPQTMADMDVPLEFVGKLLRHAELDRLSDWAIGL